MRTALVLALALAPTAAGAATAAVTDTTHAATYNVGFGPFVGGGSISTGARVRAASGYALSIERSWRLTPGLAIGPRFEVANAFINTKRHDADSGVTRSGTYDNRIFAAGLSLSQAVGNAGTFAQGLYLTAVAGRSYSKLSIDETTERTYRQNLYGNITGSYFGSELGAWIPLRGNFGINLAALGSLVRADQSDACGTYEGDQTDDGGSLSLTQGSYSCGDAGLDKQVSIRTVSAKVGLSLGF